jgi:hypothetical protein
VTLWNNPGMAELVNVDNFVRAETSRMFADLQRDAGGVNVFSHNRTPTDVEHQTVVRMNRDTLYSFAVVDISGGATIAIPEYGDRYVSVMVVNHDHYINDILHDAGEHELTVDRFDSPHVMVAARVLVDPSDPEDVAAVAALQDDFSLTARSSTPFVAPDYDTESLDATRRALAMLASNVTAFDRMFGRREEVDPVRHLIGTAVGWGGLPTHEAAYVGIDPKLPVGSYELTVREVPVDGFWSVSVYNADGFFEPNPAGTYSVNSVTAVRDEDGSITVRFGDHGPGATNCVPITEGWNYLIRLYRPRPEVLDGSWTFPSLGTT